MKIIGSTTHGHLVDVSLAELAHIMGYENSYNEEFKKLRINNEMQFEIRAINSTAYFIRNLDTSKLKTLRKSLEDAIEEIDTATDIVQQLNLFDKLMEDK